MSSPALPGGINNADIPLDLHSNKKTVYEYRNNGVQIMGHPSPETDFTETSISLDAQFISHQSETYFMRAKEMHYRAGIMAWVLPVVDALLNYCDWSLLVCAIDRDFRGGNRYRTYTQIHWENLSNKRKERLSLDGESGEGSKGVFGFITYIINDVRSGELGDCSLM